ncbi:hypothetical protein ACJMK2_023987 [Sinanodonta woodiana]|uniref:Uncharacterized protein n=1 Tax=Sinanodonta woodiana TaxID=1069815 RepID=A0ABD3T6J3_SINWO
MATVSNCFGHNCVINEEFCNKTKQGCEMCTYADNKCTENLDCLKFCSEKAAQEICGGSEEIVETAWWLYLIIAFLAVSVLVIIVLISCIFRKNKKQKPKMHKGSEKDKEDEDESRDLVPIHPGNDIMNNSEMVPIPKQPTAPLKYEMPRSGPIAQPTEEGV